MSFHVSLGECSYHANFKGGHRVHYGHSRLAQASFSYVGAAECSSDVKQAFQTYAVATRVPKIGGTILGVRIIRITAEPQMSHMRGLVE